MTEWTDLLTAVGAISGPVVAVSLVGIKAMCNRIDRLGERLVEIEHRLDGIDRRLAHVEGRLEGV